MVASRPQSAASSSAGDAAPSGGAKAKRGAPTARSAKPAKPPSDLSRMTVSLPADVRAWLDGEAVRRGVPKAVLIRELFSGAARGVAPSDGGAAAASPARPAGDRPATPEPVGGGAEPSAGVDPSADAVDVAAGPPSAAPPLGTSAAPLGVGSAVDPPDGGSTPAGSPASPPPLHTGLSGDRSASVAPDSGSPAGDPAGSSAAPPSPAPGTGGSDGRAAPPRPRARSRRLPPGVARGRAAGLLSGSGGFGPEPARGSVSTTSPAGADAAAATGLVPYQPPPAGGPAGWAGAPPSAVYPPVYGYPPLHGYQPVGVTFLGALIGDSRLMRAVVVLLMALALALGFAWLGSSVVAGRYEFREMAVAPGRAVYYRVDRWTGRMVRCGTEAAPSRSGPVC